MGEFLHNNQLIFLRKSGNFQEKSTNVSVKTIRFFYKNWQIFLLKPVHFPVKFGRLFQKNLKIFLKKLSTFPVIFHKKLTVFSGKILWFFVENLLFFTVKFNGIYRKIWIIKCSCKDSHIFLQKSVNFPVKTFKIDPYKSKNFP